MSNNNNFHIAVGVVGLNTRLGCLDPNLAPDSEAQKMISAANLSFAAVNELEYGLPLWKYFSTPKLRSLYEAQDFFTEYNLLTRHSLLFDL
jgi:hypothetical protein